MAFCLLASVVVSVAWTDVHGLILHLIARTLPAHFIHNILARNVGRLFFNGIIYGIGKRFLHVVRHPAGSDGRPTAGAQVLVRVSMVT